MSGADWTTGLGLAGALGSALVGGIFLAFSSFVMQALARLPAAHGIAAMQAINVTVLNRGFFALFFGTAVVSALAVVVAVAAWPRPGAGWLLLGGVLYLAGCIAVTGAANVPRNEALAAVDVDAPSAAQAWDGYLRGWCAWNHVRTACCAVAATGFMAAALG